TGGQLAPNVGRLLPVGLAPGHMSDRRCAGRWSADQADRAEGDEKGEGVEQERHQRPKRVEQGRSEYWPDDEGEIGCRLAQATRAHASWLRDDVADQRDQRRTEELRA